MKQLRLLITVLAFVISAPALAAPITVTIDVPQLSWVNASGDVVAPVREANKNNYYIDANGIVWGLDVGDLGTPWAATSTGAVRIFESADCTGRPMIHTNVALRPREAFYVQLDAATFTYYVLPDSPPTPFSKPARSQLYGGVCDGLAAWNTGRFYIDELTPVSGPPALPAGPWHLEVR